MTSRPGRRALALWGIIGLCCLVECTLWAADRGWIGQVDWRSVALQNGAFWTGLLNNWRPNYPAQPWLMFLTYSFLHADLWHLTGNMLVLGLLGQAVVVRSGQGGFLLIYGISVVGGAVGFAVLTNSAQPMVGASGALFGLIGAWQLWQWRMLGAAGETRRPVVKLMLWLVFLNLVMAALQPGGIAWQTHLGGYISGALAGLLCRRPTEIDTDMPRRPR